MNVKNIFWRLPVLAAMVGWALLCGGCATVKPADNAGTVYYSYNGTGYVYLSGDVFYRCADGMPLGYVEDGTIYAFGGNVLGYYERFFIYDLNGNAVGADGAKALGMDAADPIEVTKALKQPLPVKQKKADVKKPRLKNIYLSGSLEEVFS